MNLHFSEQDWQRVTGAWTAWWAGELDRPLVMIEDLRPPPGLEVSNVYELGKPACSFCLDLPVDDVLDYFQVRLEARRAYGDAWPHWRPNLGPGIMAAFLGARLTVAEDTVWLEAAEPLAIHRLEPACDPDNAWWQRTRDLTRRAVERWGSQISVGFTDLGGNLDILASLLTTRQLLLDVCDQPAEVARLSGSLTRLWLRYYDELYALIAPGGRGTTHWAPLWAPGRSYMLQSDFAYMISPRMFERFVLPDLAACCDHLDQAFYHLDGKGQIPHLDMLLSLERLRGIQWIPGDGQPPPEQWLPLLARIRRAGKLCQVYVTPEGARTIVRALGGRGFVFYITELLTGDQAQDLIRVLADEDLERR